MCGLEGMKSIFTHMSKSFKSYSSVIDKSDLFKYDAKKKVNWFLSKKKPCFGRAVEGSFLSKAGPKRGYFSYLITVRVILHTSDVSFLIIVIRYDDHPLVWSGVK